MTALLPIFMPLSRLLAKSPTSNLACVYVLNSYQFIRLRETAGTSQFETIQRRLAWPLYTDDTRNRNEMQPFFLVIIRRRVFEYVWGRVRLLRIDYLCISGG
jgi:hypothetical protein